MENNHDGKQPYYCDTILTNTLLVKKTRNVNKNCKLFTDSSAMIFYLYFGERKQAMLRHKITFRKVFLKYYIFISYEKKDQRS
ncbi:hypothetical protein CLAVI_000063 [Candidatus Clavichlamydia salmonicola]|nr:hypothetical protein [Candidatus Clavichlamydia salmonicola]